LSEQHLEREEIILFFFEFEICQGFGFGFFFTLPNGLDT
jgi:hypothetical protein